MKPNQLQHYQKNMRALLASFLMSVFTLVAYPAHATSPADFNVNGNTITFNTHDWYQVQDDTHYSTFCEGFQPCHVPDGDYIVINLTRHDRYYITVGKKSGSGSGSGTGSELLTWPNDGWYQIQDAVTLVTICEGGTSCRVHPGRYHVINLSTGGRSTILVRDRNPSYSDFTITGNTMKFTAHGWFQVQKQSNYAPICEGFHPCHVPNGNYQVINHSTGQIWMNVLVGGH